MTKSEPNVEPLLTKNELFDINNQTLIINNKKKSTPLEIKATNIRFYIIILFILYSCVNSYQWIEYSSITRLVVNYYNVSSLAVDWTSIIYMALYPILVLPASYVIDKKGLRYAGLLGCLGTALGTSIKVFSIHRDRFYLVLLGQGIVSASQLLILCLPPKIASVWFKSNEVSKACSFGVFGTQLGCAIAFIATPIIVKDHSDVDQIGSDLNLLCWLLTGSMVPMVAAILFYFPNEPVFPPSIAEAIKRENKVEFKSKEFFRKMKLLFWNKGFNIHMIAYSINIGVFSAVGIFLTQIIQKYFENADEEAGQMGFIMIIMGMIGSIAFGVLLDITHKYKETTLFIYLMSAVSVVALMFSLEWKSKVLTYISCGAVGTFTNAYMPVGFELAMELTFPAEESTTTSILMAMTQVFGVVCACAMNFLIVWIGPFWALGTQAALLGVGTLITLFVPNILRRQIANQLQTDTTE